MCLRYEMKKWHRVRQKGGWVLLSRWQKEEECENSVKTLKKRENVRSKAHMEQTIPLLWDHVFILHLTQLTLMFWLGCVCIYVCAVHDYISVLCIYAVTVKSTGSHQNRFSFNTY